MAAAVFKGPDVSEESCVPWRLVEQLAPLNHSDPRSFLQTPMEHQRINSLPMARPRIGPVHATWNLVVSRFPDVDQQSVPYPAADSCGFLTFLASASGIHSNPDSWDNYGHSFLDARHPAEILLSNSPPPWEQQSAQSLLFQYPLPQPSLYPLAAPSANTPHVHEAADVTFESEDSDPMLADMPETEVVDTSQPKTCIMYVIGDSLHFSTPFQSLISCHDHLVHIIDLNGPLRRSG